MYCSYYAILRGYYATIRIYYAILPSYYTTIRSYYAITCRATSKMITPCTVLTYIPPFTTLQLRTTLPREEVAELLPWCLEEEEAAGCLDEVTGRLDEAAGCLDG